MHTKQEFDLKGATYWDPTTGCTYVGVGVSAPRIFSNPSPAWEKYLGECCESLHRVAARESVEIQSWSTDLGFEGGLTQITHHVYACGELTGTTPKLFQWALAPSPDYETLDILGRAVKEGVVRQGHLKRAAESNCLRHDREGKRLSDPIPAQLLALALSELGWRGLVSPMDNPWAYLNTATRRIYQRSYGGKRANPSEETGLLPGQIDKRVQGATGDELTVEDLADVALKSGCSPDVICMLGAKKLGKKWNELPEYLTGLTGTKWDQRRVNAARASYDRKKDKLRTAALEASEWKAPLSKATSYKERLSKGLWNGLWTYTHSLKGVDIDIAREVMLAERKKLFVTK